ncbi:MAG: hypothetical protein HRU19_20145 [Pseudobacteriovorax sp.]|nr:hypothetical protein [Pseudobacteriovorax sp.]
MMKFIFAVVFSSLLFNQAYAKETQEFTFKAAYNWADTFDLSEAGNFAKGGKLVGSWSWNFKNGKKGNTHFTSASFFRLKPYILEGLISFNMWELEGSKIGEDTLLVSYEGLSSTPNGVTKIRAKIVGGKGKYLGATGELKWTSVNGFIDSGKGTINLK